MTTTRSGRATDGARPAPFTLRPAADEDLPACGHLWRDALNDYMGRLNLPEIPPELGPIGRLHRHVLATDPDLFWVACAAQDEAPIGFAAAARRDDLWFLSMLFVHPGHQGRGVGQALLERVLPRDPLVALATATDTAQPISNALYARAGIVPRVPLLGLLGRPTSLEPFGALPAGIRAVPFETIADGPPGSEGHRDLVETVDRLDRAVLGFGHPGDHRFLRTEGRRGFLYRDASGTPVAYGYASEVGRVGPVAVLDEGILPAVLGHLLGAIEPRGASVVWVAGTAGRAVEVLLRAGMRIDGFPVLLCWSRPFGDFGRYLPISPGLL